VQRQEVPVRAEFFVDVFPEAARLPQAAGLSVADGRNRKTDYLGELGLCESGGPASARKAGRQSACSVRNGLLTSRGNAGRDAGSGATAGTGDKHTVSDKCLQRLAAS
jgi:hypothetical protein